MVLLLKSVEDKLGESGLQQMLEMEDVERSTALMISVESGSGDSAKVLIEAGARVNIVNDNNLSPLHLAATHGVADIAKILLDHEAEVDTVNSADQTPLHAACGHGNVDMVDLLLEHEAEIEHRDKDGMTPLLTAVKFGHVTVLKKLLHHGALVTVIDKDDRSPLYLAAERNHMKCLRTLVKTSSIDWLMRRNDRWDNTAIHVASSGGNLDIVMALIEAGAQIDNKNEDEQTPVHLAAKHGRLKVLKYILGHDRYSVNDEDFESQTALHLASSGGHDDIVQELIRAGADIHARNSYLWSPLACAAAQGWVKCAKHLLKVKLGK